MTAIIVESPTVANQVLKHLYSNNIDAQVISTNGHIYDYGFAADRSITFVPINPKAIKTLTELNRRQADIIIATDPDEQGELIGLHIKSLTPQCRHKRMIINDVSIQGFIQTVNRFNNNEFQFNPLIAQKAYLLKVLNLTLKYSNQRYVGQREYLTTPAIEILAYLREQKEPVFENSYQLKLDKQKITCKEVTPTIGVDLEGQFDLILSACESNDIHKANLTIDVNKELQSSFESGKISYPRTRTSFLPANAMNVIKDWTARGGFIIDITPFSDDNSLSHYALHNTALPTSRIEQQIRSVNQLAIGDQLIKQPLVKLKNGDRAIYGSTMNQNALAETSRMLTPSERIKSMLIERGASPSTLQQHSNKYSTFMYKRDGRLNTHLINKLELVGQRECSRLIDLGVDNYIESLVKHSNDEVIELDVTDVKKVLQEEIQDTISGHHF
ncbi:toprim domain-containing protein [Photobacterium leiognathi]|uniref:toprim domain-containing protein n=1 Tax=Photobacterium leiognathi TaxID=553611 RepID=UPI0029817C2E|nr:toprim domain-containing protein [Photobacterium leiognathi]